MMMLPNNRNCAIQSQLGAIELSSYHLVQKFSPRTKNCGGERSVALVPSSGLGKGFTVAPIEVRKGLTGIEVIK